MAAYWLDCSARRAQGHGQERSRNTFEPGQNQLEVWSVAESAVRLGLNVQRNWKVGRKTELLLPRPTPDAR